MNDHESPTPAQHASRESTVTDAEDTSPPVEGELPGDTADAPAATAQPSDDEQGGAAASGAADTPAEPDLEQLAAADPRTPAELLGALMAAEIARDEYLDDLRRARAEFDNYRRRVMRESTSQREAGKAEAVEGLLEVLDDLDRTLPAARDSADTSLGKGIELVASKLVQSLQSLGLARIDQTDVAFDPTEHEAVQQQPSDEPSGTPTVVQVLRPGYRLGEERVLRPAMVVVRE